MIDIDKLIGRMVQLEQEYLELKLAYDELKKERDEAYRAGYRNGLESQKDSSGNH